MTSETPAALRLDASDFELFDLPQRFGLDRAVLDARWRTLMASVHPDRFAAGSPAQQCEAMQRALRVNQAYERLKHPLSRANYLCSLNGQHVDGETNTAMPPGFLMQVMEWREALERAATHHEIQALVAAAAARRRGLLDELSDLIDTHGDWTAAAVRVRSLMFTVRFEQELDRRTGDGYELKPVRSM